MSQGTAHELIVRGVLVSCGQVLLCRRKGLCRAFLPGGHIEAGESAAGALRRELREELGCRATVGGFLGVVEHRFHSKGKRVCELNLLFAVRARGLASAKAPPSAEVHLEFFWHALSRLEEVGFEPAVLRRLLADWVADPCVAVPRFASAWPGRRRSG